MKVTPKVEKKIDKLFGGIKNVPKKYRTPIGLYERLKLKQ